MILKFFSILTETYLQNKTNVIIFRNIFHSKVMVHLYINYYVFENFYQNQSILEGKQFDLETAAINW